VIGGAVCRRSTRAIRIADGLVRIWTMPEHLDEPPSETFGPREFLQTIRKRKLYVIVTAALTVGLVAFSVVRQPPVYRSLGQVLVLNPSLDPTGRTQDVNLDTEAALAASPQVASEAAEILQTDADPQALLGGLSVAVQPSTELLLFAYTAGDPETARAAVNAFVDGYMKFRRERFLDQSFAASRAIQERIDTAQLRLTKTRRRLAAATSLSAREQLQARANTLTAQVVFLQQQSLAALSSPEVGQVIESGSAPTLVDTRKRTLLLALFVGLALGAGVALLVERFDDRLRGRKDLATYTAAPVLATIPHFDGSKRWDSPVLATMTAPESEVSEAYRRLRTGMLFAATQDDVHTVLVTSSEPSEGKTTTVANLAAALGGAGKRVIVVAADLRRPRLEAFFGLDNGTNGSDSRPGLTNILAGEIGIDEALIAVPDLPNVSVLPSGPMVANPAELLESNAMRRIMAYLRDRADVILIDGTPVLGVSDALAISQLTDAVLLVADATQARRTTVSQARAQLAQVNGKLIGTVLNNLDPKRAKVYGEG
jgi:non-specific protein-tyrosine kinase